jgi:hypothetical protein
MRDVSHPSNYERSDADPRLIGALALGVAAFLAITPFLLLAIYPRAERAGVVSAAPPLPPTPRLQVNPKADLDHLRAAERQQLQTYGWIDRDHQVVRIPIEQAMQLLVSRGLPDWPAPAAAPASR